VFVQKTDCAQIKSGRIEQINHLKRAVLEKALGQSREIKRKKTVSSFSGSALLEFDPLAAVSPLVGIWTSAQSVPCSAVESGASALRILRELSSQSPWDDGPGTPAAGSAK
jgi:hypothetical protein